MYYLLRKVETGGIADEENWKLKIEPLNSFPLYQSWTRNQRNRLMMLLKDHKDISNENSGQNRQEDNSKQLKLPPSLEGV